MYFTDEISIKETKLKYPICRICLQECEKKSFSLNDNFRDLTISIHIENLAHVQIIKGDNLPNQICKVCLFELEAALCFKEKCAKSEKYLLSISKDNLIKGPDVDLKIENPESDNDVGDKLEISEKFTDNTTEKHDNISSQEELKVKRETQPVKLELQCDDCKQYFRSKCKLRVHWKKIHLLESLLCPKCKRTFKSMAAYNNHIKRNKRNCVAASHMRIEGVGKTRMFYCKYCEYKSNVIEYLATHIVIHNGNRQYQCDICLNRFTQTSSLIRHKEAIHNINKVIITCQYCGETIKGRDKVYKHLSRHKEIQKYECDVCKRMMKNKSSLRVHMLRHSVKTYVCENCAKSFYTSVELRAHRIQVHQKEKQRRYKCGKCDYECVKHFSMKKHRAKHTESNISCSFCGIFFEREQEKDYKKHQKRHFAERKFSCTMCDRKYVHSDGLNWHMKKKHGKFFTAMKFYSEQKQHLAEKIA